MVYRKQTFELNEAIATATARRMARDSVTDAGEALWETFEDPAIFPYGIDPARVFFDSASNREVFQRIRTRAEEKFQQLTSTVDPKE